MTMTVETVLYFDILGFRHKSKDQAEAAVDALTDLATLLGTDAITHLLGPWASRYALSDSVFLTHPDPDTAVRQAAALVFNLVSLTLHDEEPLLIRGALARGPVRHVKGIFLKGAEPANLVGQAVVDAVVLEQGSGLKGPRILVAEDLARAVSQPLREWLLRPTSVSGVWEALWLLPANPSDFSRDEKLIKNFCDRAIELLRAHGGHPGHGAHYRDFLWLAARSIERAKRAMAAGKLNASVTASYLDPSQLMEAFEATSGIPDEYITSVMPLIESIA